MYPGHGNPAGPGLLADQRRYLLYYREPIRRLSEGEPVLSDAAKSELSTAMQAFLPDAPLTWLIVLGADAVAAELAVNPAYHVRPARPAPRQVSSRLTMAAGIARATANSRRLGADASKSKSAGHSVVADMRVQDPKRRLRAA